MLRLTLTAAGVTDKRADDCYWSLSRVASRGGPYAAILDLSGVTVTTLSPYDVRGLAWRDPAVPAGREQVVVAKEPFVFGLARIFQLCRDVLGHQYQVVRSLEEAYAMLGVRSENFTQRVFPQDQAA